MKIIPNETVRNLRRVLTRVLGEIAGGILNKHLWKDFFRNLGGNPGLCIAFIGFGQF